MRHLPVLFHTMKLPWGALHDYGDSAQWQRLVRDGERLLEDVVAGHLQVEQPTEFAFDALNDALIFSKEEKQKAVVLNQ